MKEKANREGREENEEEEKKRKKEDSSQYQAKVWNLDFGMELLNLSMDLLFFMISSLPQT